MLQQMAWHKQAQNKALLVTKLRAGKPANRKFMEEPRDVTLLQSVQQHQWLNHFCVWLYLAPVFDTPNNPLSAVLITSYVSGLSTKTLQ
jgi:hypothetical protein